MTPRRAPYVGAGLDGARRSAQIDRDELATLGRDEPRRAAVEASLAEWEREAAALEGEACPKCGHARVFACLLPRCPGRGQWPPEASS